MTSRTLAKRLIALVKRPKTLANVTLAKSLVGKITAIPQKKWREVKEKLHVRDVVLIVDQGK